jgi:hypothetical protein
VLTIICLIIYVFDNIFIINYADNKNFKDINFVFLKNLIGSLSHILKP